MPKYRDLCCPSPLTKPDTQIHRNFFYKSSLNRTESSGGSCFNFLEYYTCNFIELFQEYRIKYPSATKSALREKSCLLIVCLLQ